VNRAGLLLGLKRLRLLLVIAGLASFAGLEFPAWQRALIAVLAVAAVAFDTFVDEPHHFRTTKTATVPTQRTHP